MKKITIIICIFIILILVVSQTSAFKNIGKPSKTYSAKTKIKLGDIKDVISASGKIQSDSVATLKFQTSGLLTYVGVKKGDIVQKGQLIAALDQRELEKTLKKDLNDYMTSRWSFEEGKQVTYKDQALSNTIQRALDKNQFALDNTVLDVEISDIALKFANLYSPITGIVTEIDAPEAGVNITAAGATFTIVDYNNIIFSINVDETDIAKVQVGQLVDIKLDAYENEIFPGVISKIGFSSTTTSAGNTAFPVEVKFPDNSYLKFKIGMNGDAEIINKEKKGILVVPTDYIFEDQSGKYVYTLGSNNQIIKNPVKTGIETDNKVEIISGIKQKTTIVIPNN